MKNLIILFAALITVNLSAQTVTIPTNKAKVDSVLFEMVYNNTFDQTFSNPVKSNGSTTYLVDLEKWNPNESELDLILNNGGVVNQSTLVIKFPVNALGSLVSNQLSNYQYVGASGLATMTYAFWFKRTGLYTYNGFCYVLTIDWIGNILTGAQIKQILNLSPQCELMGQFDSEFINAKTNGIKAF